MNINNEILFMNNKHVITNYKHCHLILICACPVRGHTLQSSYDYSAPPPLSANIRDQMEFLDERHICGQTILKLVSRANAIIAELLRLSEFIPPVLKLEGKDKLLYTPILPDFSYFEGPEYYENRINANTVSILYI